MLYFTASTLSEPNQLLNFMTVTKMGKFLGEGCYGSVHVVELKGHTKTYAAKSFSREIRCKDQQKFMVEFHLLYNLKHDNIVRYIGLACTNDVAFPLLIMELMKISLFKRIYCKHLTESSTFEDLSLQQKLRILYDVAKGLNYLHTRNPLVIHRDLTAHNVLLDDSDRAKIADFGNAKMITFQQCQQEYQTAYPGAKAYSAPEVSLGNCKYDDKCDIFSFAHLTLCTLSEMSHDLSCARSVDDNGQLQAYTEIQRRTKYFATLQEENDLIEKLMIKQCLEFKAADRPAAYELVETLSSLLHDPDHTDSCISTLRVISPQLDIDESSSSSENIL